MLRKPCNGPRVDRDHAADEEGDRQQAEVGERHHPQKTAQGLHGRYFLDTLKR